jgi:thiol-disulfide isomerase/thioredoxin
MKNFRPYLLIFCCCVSLNIFAQEIRTDKIDFQSDPEWKKVLSQAKRSDKIIFLDAYTSWCRPCKKMEKTVFTQPEVANYFNQKFINVKYDMEKGEGVDLKKKYGVGVFPTYLFITGKGKVVHRIVGAHLEQGDFLRYAKMAVTPGKSYVELQRRYEKGERNSEMMFDYLQVLRLAGEKDKEAEIVQQYLKLMSKDHFMDSSYWGIVKAFMNDPNSREFKILLENREEIGAAIGMAEVDGKIYEVLAGQLKILEAMSVEKGDELMSMLRQSELPQRNLLLAQTMAAQHLRKGEYYEYASLVDHMIDFNLLLGHPDPLSEYNRHAGIFEKHVVDDKLLRRALRWSEHVCEKETASDKLTLYIQTKSQLMQKLGAVRNRN